MNQRICISHSRFQHRFLLFLTGIFLLLGGCFKEEPEFTATGNNPARYEFMTSYTIIDYDSRKGYDFYTSIYNKNIDIHFPQIDSNLVNEQFSIDIKPIGNMSLIEGDQGFRLLRALYLEPADHWFFEPVTVVFQIPASININKVYAFTFGKEGESVNYIPIISIESDGDNNLVKVSSGNLCGIGIAEVQNPSYESYRNIKSTKDYLSLISEKTRQCGTFSEIQAAGGLSGSVAGEVSSLYHEWLNFIFNDSVNLKNAALEDWEVNFLEESKQVKEGLDNCAYTLSEGKEATLENPEFEDAKDNLESAGLKAWSQLSEQCKKEPENCARQKFFNRSNQVIQVFQSLGINSTDNDFLTKEFCGSAGMTMLYSMDKLFFRTVRLGKTAEINPVYRNRWDEKITPDPEPIWYVKGNSGIIGIDSNKYIRGLKLGEARIYLKWCNIPSMDTVTVEVGEWFQGNAVITLKHPTIETDFTVTVFYELIEGFLVGKYADVLINEREWRCPDGPESCFWQTRAGHPIQKVFRFADNQAMNFYGDYKLELNYDSTITVTALNADQSIRTIGIPKLLVKEINYYPDYLETCLRIPSMCPYWQQ